MIAGRFGHRRREALDKDGALAIVSLLSLCANGCLTAGKPRVAGGERIVICDTTGLAVTNGRGLRPFTPWGCNYDRTAFDGRDVLLEDVLRERPGKLDRDFAAMRRLGCNTVRVFVALSLVLRSANEVDAAGVQRIQALLQAAHRQGLWVILTGLANIRPSTAPQWVQEADDETMIAAQKLFWQAVARACRDAPAVLAYDLQNEPAVHSRDSASWTDGCFEMPTGPPLCYVHRLYRQIESRWTRHVQEQFRTAEALREHWPGFPRPGEDWDSIAVPENPKDARYGQFVAFHSRLLRDWSLGLREAIRREDGRHLITVGPLDPVPMAEAVDFYCMHLYPQAADSADAWRKKNRTHWTRQIERVPRDKPLVIEEMYPLALAPGISYEAYLQQFLEVTESRAAGWISFYWGEPEELPASSPFQNALYGDWLKIWSRYRPSAAAETSTGSKPAITRKLLPEEGDDGRRA